MRLETDPHAFIDGLYRSVFRRPPKHGVRVTYSPEAGEPVEFVFNYGRWEYATD